VPITWLPSAFEVLSAATSSQDLCRRIVHHPVVGKDVSGACLYSLTNSGNYVRLGSYGLIPIEELDNSSQFEDNLLSKTINSREISLIQSPNDSSIIAIPGIKAGLPNGVLVVGVRSEVKDLDEIRSLDTLSIMTNALGLFIGGTGIEKVKSIDTNQSQRPLTRRQLIILHGMVEGRTNQQIATELILSESAIKQEAVKIFRSLGVATRQDAAIKASALGILDSEFSAAK
jgi:DNA-binding CsgD family transcriptional regulator